jgi:uncharacterized membrane protein
VKETPVAQFLGLHRSKWIVIGLSLLFMVDSFAVSADPRLEWIVVRLIVMMMMMMVMMMMMMENRRRHREKTGVLSCSTMPDLPQ